MKKREESELTVRQYVSINWFWCYCCDFLHQEKQFTIIRELLRSNDRMGMLNEAEKRSLEFLKDGKKRISMSPGQVMTMYCAILYIVCF